jgi:putative ABC transport system permease protein
MLLGIFAAFALLLATLGIYGVISHSTSQRTHEIGIRIALGARSTDVVRLVVGHALVLAFTGVVVGLAGALGLMRFISSLLYGVGPADPLTFVIIAGVVTLAALIASYIPARRATKVDPMVALRYE